MATRALEYAGQLAGAAVALGATPPSTAAGTRPALETERAAVVQAAETAIGGAFGISDVREREKEGERERERERERESWVVVARACVYRSPLLTTAGVGRAWCWQAELQRLAQAHRTPPKAAVVVSAEDGADGAGERRRLERRQASLNKGVRAVFEALFRLLALLKLALQAAEAQRRSLATPPPQPRRTPPPRAPQARVGGGGGRRRRPRPRLRPLRRHHPAAPPAARRHAGASSVHSRSPRTRHWGGSCWVCCRGCWTT
eukprot:SAG25_NODE_176_length_12787_cov_14.980060_8_plen_260_part_00